MQLDSIVLKKIHLSSQGLLERPPRHSAKKIIERLSYLQIDSIYSIARSQDLVLHSRSSSYQEEDVWKDLKSGKLFEGWAHARCLLPISEFPYQYSSMIRRRETKVDWIKFVKEKNWQSKIMKQIETTGPISSSDLQPMKIAATITGWNTFKKRLLDFLFFRGYIAVKYRKKLRVFYDLPENCIPNFASFQDHLPTSMDEFWKDIEISLQALGVSTIHRLLHYRHRQSRFNVDGKKVQPKDVFDGFVRKGKIIEVERKNKKTLYHLPGFLQTVDTLLSTDKPHCQLLSPFDNSLWSRESLLDQYGYDYKMEIYVPKAKRVFGYFVLPILFGTEFVGRVDTSYHRKTKTMNFIKWSWEDGFKPSDEFLLELAKTLNRFIEFHHAENVTLGDFPKEYLKDLKSQLSIL